jgi:hypothetical protein
MTAVAMQMALIFSSRAYGQPEHLRNRRADAQIFFVCFGPESGVNYSDEAGTPDGLASAVPVLSNMKSPIRLLVLSCAQTGVIRQVPKAT